MADHQIITKFNSPPNYPAMQCNNNNFYACKLHAHVLYFIRVVFNCVKDGEFWYELDLFADNPKSTSISPISCELGK